MKPYYEEDNIKIYCGDCLSILPAFPEKSVDLVVTSPPYDNLRDYKGYSFDFEGIAKELYKVVSIGGIIVWIVGDAVINGSETGTSFRQALYFKEIGFNLHDTMIYKKQSPAYPAYEKSIRYGQVFEYMFVLSKGTPKAHNLLKDKKNRWAGELNFGTPTRRNKNGELKKGKKKIVSEYGFRENIWQYHAGSGYGQQDISAYKHPATFPQKLANDHILSWSNPDDLVFDPLLGSGTTLVTCKELGRRGIGIEISEKYCEIAVKRLKNTQKDLFL